MQLDDLTVFVISSGEETEEDCMAALKAQSCSFRIERITGVRPMSAAFQAMPDRCETPYFLQVDADMILNPDAVHSLYALVRRAPFWVYRVSGSLYEEGFGIGGAVKCWRRSIFRYVRFRDRRTVDRDLHHRLRLFGFRIQHIDDVIGIHRPRHSDFSRYLKAKSDVEKWRYLKRPAERYALPLLGEILVDGEEERHRLLGVLLGALTGPARLVRSKDTSLEKERFLKLLALLGNDAELSAYQHNGQGGELRATFARSCDDFRGADSAKRVPLARILGATFAAAGKSGDGFSKGLLEIADQ